MKAVVNEIYGSPDVLEYKEVETPEPGENEALIKIHASSVNAFDWHMLRPDPFFIRFMAGLFKPKNNILGVDVAGYVESIGKNVKQLKPGDEVYGDLSPIGCGGFAEYVCANENYIALKPVNLSFEEAAAIPLAAVTALQGLRDKGKIQEGHNVLINGASGGVGTFAVQIAKSFGAQVTAVCSAKNLETASSIGADKVIDYTKEDFAKGDECYDLIFVAYGNRSVFDYKRALKPKGLCVIAGGSMAQFFKSIFFGPLISVAGNKKIISYVAQPNQKDLEYLKELIEAGKVKPVIDRRYPLAEVPDAIRYVEEGHARGKVVINVK
jgi:NADPH:quinone reductase-like Zn-dependent oxidoreductase